MTAVRHDSSRMVTGLGFALTSAVAFSLSGPLARGLMDAGWSAGATVAARILLAAALLLPVALVLLRGRWRVLRANVWLVVGYGLGGVALAQFAFFNAIRYLPVGMALLIEYTAPVAVVLWLWVRRGQRPTWLSVAGAVVAMGGLVLVLDVIGGTSVNLAGVGWGLLAMAGAASYFLLSGRADTGLPPLVMAAGGLLTGGLTILVLGLVGLVGMDWAQAPASYRGVGQVPWWAPMLLLGVVTAALAYAAGIAGARRLGSRVASFVGLSEVLAALVFAWLLLGEQPKPVQLVGAALVVTGVVVVKLGERETVVAALPEPDVAVDPADHPEPARSGPESAAAGQWAPSSPSSSRLASSPPR